MVRSWQKLRDKVRREGFAYALQLLSRRLPPALFYANRFIVFALDLPANPPGKAAEAEPAGLREASVADSEILAHEGRSRAEIEARFAGGARAWIEAREGRLLGHAWIDPRSLPWDRCLRLTGAAGDTWSIDGWVAPDQRGRGCYTRVKGAAAAGCAAAGHRRLLAAVDALNRNSVRANRAIGARPVSRGFILRLFGLCLIGHDGRLRAGIWTEAEPLELGLGPEGSSRPG